MQAAMDVEFEGNWFAMSGKESESKFIKMYLT